MARRKFNADAWNENPFGFDDDIFEGDEDEEQETPAPAPAPAPAPDPAPKPVPKPKPVPTPKPTVSKFDFDEAEMLVDRLQNIQEQITAYRQAIEKGKKLAEINNNGLESDCSNIVNRVGEAADVKYAMQELDVALRETKHKHSTNSENILLKRDEIIDFQQDICNLVEMNNAYSADLEAKTAANDGKPPLQDKAMLDLHKAMSSIIYVKLRSSTMTVDKYFERVNKEFDRYDTEFCVAAPERIVSKYRNALGRKQSRFETDQEYRDINEQRTKEYENKNREQEMTEERQRAAQQQFSLLETGSGYGGTVALKNLSKILMHCILVEYGDASRIVSFGIDEKQSIIINDEVLDIKNQLEFGESELNRLCKKDQEAIKQGKWGSCFNFTDLYNFGNLQTLDLSRAPATVTAYARKELGINKGNWGTLFRRKTKLPNLELIKLPEGDVTKETSSIWSKFKSESAYQTYEREARQQRSGGVDGGGVIEAVGNGISTIKDVVWNKPLPRILLKTFGYGVGVPLYWGMMTAMGPFGLLMGALGVGALAHQEVKHYKETGSM